jgi:hypothetical protein
VFEPALPGRSSIARLSAVLASHAPSGWKPYPDLNVGAARSLSLRAVISVASRSMTSQPASSFPAMASHGNPAGLAQISCHTRARTAARARAILSRVRASASSSVRRTVVSDGAAPKTGSWCASTVISLMLVAPSAIATAIETSAIPRSISGNFSFRPSAAPSADVRPH